MASKPSLQSVLAPPVSFWIMRLALHTWKNFSRDSRIFQNVSTIPGVFQRVKNSCDFFFLPSQFNGYASHTCTPTPTFLAETIPLLNYQFLLTHVLFLYLIIFIQYLIIFCRFYLHQCISDSMRSGFIFIFFVISTAPGILSYI